MMSTGELNSSFDFLGSLTESTLIRSKQSLSNYNARDIADAIFLNFLALEVLRHEDPSSTIVAVYAANVIRYGEFDSFRIGGNDLYQLLYIVLGKHAQETHQLLKDQKASLVLLNTLVLNKMKIKRYLLELSHNREGESINTFFLELESHLKINNTTYRNLRRSIVNWSELEVSEKEDVAKRLETAFRQRIIRSELRGLLTSLINRLDQ